MTDVIWIPPNNLRQAGYEEGYRDGVEAIMNQARSHASIDRRMVSLPFLEGVASRLVDEKP